MPSFISLRSTVSFKTALVATVLSSLILAGCATNIAGRKQIMLVTESSAIQASKQAYTETLAPIKQAGKLDNNSAMVARVKRITDRLVTQAKIKRPETQNWQWTVSVVDDPQTVNAWCMAGGKMAIYSGLINKLSATDDEIAQVMGHEISHALANHSAERMSVAMAQGMALDLLQQTTGLQAQSMSLASAAAQVALTLPNSRRGETEADIIGIELAAKAGFNPAAAITLWQKMGAQSQAGLEFMSTHPSPDNRQKKLESLQAKMLPFYHAAKR